MIFNSLTFLLFLSVVVSLYWFLPYRARLFLILFSSLTFYSFWRIEFLPLLLFSTVLDWLVALRMYSQPKKKRFSFLLISLTLNIGLLFYFKYLIFFAENFVNLSNLLGFAVDPLSIKIILPLGISFYTFQTISYSVDVYRGVIKPERDFVLYACFVTFFPQLVAGPILRAGEVMHQFVKPRRFSFDSISEGLRRIMFGLFLKVVLADNISPYVDAGFSMRLETVSALDVLTLSFLFGFQIYFDFSAYSHIALGSARILGITFPENFNFPYMACSPKEFWKRWHISLSSWIRDYLYLPLAKLNGQANSKGGLAAVTATNGLTKSLFLTWSIMGLWHGANWTFLVWGIYHAIVIVIYRIVVPHTRFFGIRLRYVLGWIITLPIMMLAWIPFRAESLSSAFSMWGKLFILNNYTWLGMRENIYIITSLILLGIIMINFIQKKFLTRIRNKKITVAVGDFLLMSCCFALVFIFLRPISQFIYFQF